MRRKELLIFLEKQLAKIGATFPLDEIYLPQGFNGVSALRTLLVSNAPSVEDIIQLFDRFTTGEMQTSWFARYDDINKIRSSGLIPENAADLNLNWRGRLWKWTDLSNISTQDEFNEKILASYWRFLVTKRDNDYFARFEISPCYLNPGHSTAGFSDFREQINYFLNFLSSKKERWQVDPEFDRVIFFARKEPNKTFGRCNPNFFSGNYISYGDLENLINQRGKDQIVDEIYSAITNELR